MDARLSLLPSSAFRRYYVRSWDGRLVAMGIHGLLWTRTEFGGTDGHLHYRLALYCYLVDAPGALFHLRLSALQQGNRTQTADPEQEIQRRAKLR